MPPISPSRLRPWKAPKKESSFAAAGFLAVVVCRGRQWWLLKWVLVDRSAFFLASTACCRFLSLFSSAWYALSQESGTFWLLQGRLLLLLLMLFLRVKLLLRTDWLLLAPLLAEVLFPDTQLVNCFRGAPSDMRESISRVVTCRVTI